MGWVRSSLGKPLETDATSLGGLLRSETADLDLGPG